LAKKNPSSLYTYILVVSLVFLYLNQFCKTVLDCFMYKYIFSWFSGELYQSHVMSCLKQLKIMGILTLYVFCLFVFIINFNTHLHFYKQVSIHLLNISLPNQGFQYFSSVPVFHYLQVVLFLKIWTFFMNILCNTLWN